MSDKQNTSGFTPQKPLNERIAEQEAALKKEKAAQATPAPPTDME